MTISKNLRYAPPRRCAQGATAQTIRGPFPMTLRDAIGAAGLSINAFALYADIPVETVLRIAKGVSKGNAVTRQRIAAALGISVGRIIWPEKVA